MDSLFDFIKLKHTDNDFIDRIERISNLKNKLFKKLSVSSGGKNKNNMLTTLRMTSVELA